MVVVRGSFIAECRVIHLENPKYTVGNKCIPCKETRVFADLQRCQKVYFKWIVLPAAAAIKGEICY